MKERIVYKNRTYVRDPDSKYSSARLYFIRKQYDIRTKKEKKQFLHRVIWEDYNGPIPKGHVIHHKNLNSLDNSIENLECIPEYEHHKKFHRLHRVRQTIDKMCERCGSEYKATTKRSRFCIQCTDIIRSSGKERKRFYGY